MPQLVTHAGAQEVKGFRFGASHCGLKKDRLDLGIIEGIAGTTGAAVFTQNAFAAAPVHLSRQNVRGGDVRAIVVNSGNANACTGRDGLRSALRMARKTAEKLGIDPEQVIVASTGIIGEPLDINKVEAGIEAATSQQASADDVANAILTTDSGPKQSLRHFRIGDRQYTLAAITKGAGMIHPNMATMLSFVLTDAPVEAGFLQQSLRQAVDVSFNQITIDGDESTNDMVAVLASGAGGGEPLNKSHEQAVVFQKTLRDVLINGARQIVADGEGTTRAMEVRITGAPDDMTARAVSRGISSSTLVKAALHGVDPNWGRIAAAVGQAWRDADPTQLGIRIQSQYGHATLVEDGQASVPDEASTILRAPWVTFHIDVGDGHGEAVAWGSDMSPDTIAFNAAYRT